MKCQVACYSGTGDEAEKQISQQTSNILHFDSRCLLMQEEILDPQISTLTLEMRRQRERAFKGNCWLMTVQRPEPTVPDSQLIKNYALVFS